MTIKSFDACNELVIVAAVDQNLKQLHHKIESQDEGVFRVITRDMLMIWHRKNILQRCMKMTRPRAHTCVFFLTESARIDSGPLHIVTQ
jgi:hypothetical protein